MNSLKTYPIHVRRFLHRLLSEFKLLLFYFFIDSFFAIKKSLVKTHRKILIFKLDPAIGDMILWLPASKEIREYYKDWHISLVCDVRNKELTESFDYFNEVIGINSKSFVKNIFYRISILKQISKLSADIAIYPNYSRDFLLGGTLIRVCSAKQKIGFRGDDKSLHFFQNYISSKNYTKFISFHEEGQMELERNAEFLKGIGITSIQPRVANISKLLDLPEHLIVKEPYFIIFPGASAAYRIWPFDRFASVAKLVAEHFNWRVLICGSSSEYELSNQISDLINLSNTLNLAGKTSLPELVEVIRHSKLLIGNETSSVHIAAAVSTPSVCVLGGGHFNRFMPYPETVKGMKPAPVFHPMDCYFCDWHCKLTRERTKPYPCIQNIDVNSVMNAVGKALQASSIENLYPR